MSRPARYKCIAVCPYQCRVMAHTDEEPPRCPYWKEKQSWIRTDKHGQKQLNEFDDGDYPAGLGYGFN